MGLVATYHHPIVGNTTSLNPKNGGRWQVDFQAQWKNGVEKWKPEGWLCSCEAKIDGWKTILSFWDAFLSSTILLSGRVSFFRLDPSIAGNLSKRVVLCKNFVKFVVFVGVQMWPHIGFFSISLQKISLFFYRKRHLYKSTAANDILHKNKATLWHILLAPGGTEPWICFCAWKRR